MREKIENLLIDLHAKLGDDFLKLDIREYVDKILSHARIISIMNEDKLEAFIAFYDNDVKKEIAFVSLLAVDEDCWGKSYGRILMEAAFAMLSQQGFKYFDLHYIPGNTRSTNTAKSYGFKITNWNNTLILRKQL